MKGKIFKRDTDYYFLRKFKDNVYENIFFGIKNSHNLKKKKKTNKKRDMLTIFLGKCN